MLTDAGDSLHEYSFFEERTKEGFVLFFGAKKRTKRNIHPI